MICDFLAIFEECSKEVEATKKPTLHLVVPWYYRLVLHCEPSANDHPIIADMKERGLQYLQTNIKLKITFLHQIATFLCPSFKSLKMYSANTTRSIVNRARNMLDAKFPFESEPGTLRRTSCFESILINRLINSSRGCVGSPIAASRSRRSVSTSSSSSAVSQSLSMFQDESCSFLDEDRDELQAYIDSSAKAGSDLLEWYDFFIARDVNCPVIPTDIIINDLPIGFHTYVFRFG